MMGCRGTGTQVWVSVYTMSKGQLCMDVCATSVEIAVLVPGMCFSHATLFPAANTPPTYPAIWDQECLIYLLIPSDGQLIGCVLSVPEQTETQILQRTNSPEFRHRIFCS